MDQKEALSSLETIRTILERSTHYTHIAPAGIVAAGVAATVSALAGAGFDLGPDRGLSFLLLWGLVFLTAAGVGVGASAQRARRRGEAFWSRKLQYVVAGFMPSMVGAAILTAALHDGSQLSLCPGLWMICYGIGILSVGVVLDWEFRATAWAFLVAGTASLFVLREHPHLCLGLGFGGLHIVLGGFRLATEGVDSWRARTPFYDSRT
jgi:hypothetical protein